MKTLKTLLISSTLAFGILSGCTEKTAMASEEIMTNILSTSKEFQTYYAESETKTFQDGKETDLITMKEYVNNEGKKKVITKDAKTNKETIAFNDGKQILTYEAGSKEAISLNVEGVDLPVYQTHKEQFINMLESMKKNYKKEVVGEEKILDFDTYHLKLTTKKENSILGDIEFWVDQKSWFIVKSSFTNAEMRVDTEYKKVDFNPVFEKDTFAIDLPEDVVITPAENMTATRSGSIEEAKKVIEKDFLLFNEPDLSFEEEIEISEFGEKELAHKEIVLNYKDVNDEPLFSLTIFKALETEDIDLGMETANMKVRGNKATYIEELRNLSWNENGLTYSILIENPDMKVEEIVKKAENMKLSSK
ncbi:LolA family protein [Metabacillus fastidiosus]|uniref:LolA family protein n=1 Tax=Metabacillus fastidiosus TaxID=1458 RepID=UPI003D2919AB